jgi:hypothetical protein
MAGLGIVAATGEFATATATKTMLQIIAPANHRVRINYVEISGKGISATDAPVLWKVARQTTAGTATGLTVGLTDALATETVQTTASRTATVEPTTAATNVGSTMIHPQKSARIYGPWLIPGGGRLGVIADTPTQANTWNVTAYGEE